MLSTAYLSALLVHLIFFLPLAHAGAQFPRFETTLGPNAHKYAVGKLPHVDYQLTPSWAGQILVPGTRDDELFFWLFEAETASNNLISMKTPACDGGFAESFRTSLAEWRPGLLFHGWFGKRERPVILSGEQLDSKAQSLSLDKTGSRSIY